MGFGNETIGSIFGSTMFFLIFFSLLLSQHNCAEVYKITPSQPFSQTQILVSPSRIFKLGFFSPNGSVNKYVGIWHMNISPRKVVWVANRENPIAASDTFANLTISSYGNLELVDGKQNSLWSTNISVPSNGSAAELLDSGNFVIKDDDVGADPLWQSFDYPSDTLLPTMQLGFDSKSGKRSFLKAWKSESDPSAGWFSVGLSRQVPSQLFVWINESKPYLRSGAWDKSMFIGVPDMDSQYLSGFTLNDDVNQGTKYFSYRFFDKTLSYIGISSDGVLSLKLSNNGSNWWLSWEALVNPCEIYGTCGVNGVCKGSESPNPNCECLKGFVPKSNEEWSKGNWTGGCVRHTELFCEQSNTSRSFVSGGKEDVFWKMVGLRLPDFHELIEKLGAEECKIRCLNNCSCQAYAQVNNIGCLVWSSDLIDIQEFSSGGNDLYIRLAHGALDEGKPVKLIASVTAVGFITILSAIAFGVHRLRSTITGNMKAKTKLMQLNHTSDHSGDNLQEYIRKHDPSELFIYDFDSILTATNNFSTTNKLGEGGFGPVYKGKLQEGREIAVKRLSSSSGQGMEEFKNEMLLISKLQHKNLVRIMGCCVKDDEKLLIYEFMPNRSLDTLLFDPKRREELDWATRFNIIQGVARGLLYLHHDSRLKVIHRDLKVSNILLDENMNPKISDFGLARIVEATQSLANTHKVVGTRGYMSPEYAMGGIFSEKSDVYSFGVLLLEIIANKKNNSFYCNEEQHGFLAHVWHLWIEGRGLDLLDEVLVDSYSSLEVMRCMHIGLLCVQDKSEDRPTMPDVVFTLSSETDLPLPKQPIFSYFRISVSNPQPKYDNILSANEDAITVIEGR
ncbi:G-type lectin S-receptor-like serine/threonine-protein kinase At1g61500 isoform X1 [Malus sylvestris]|uniref:G-type lectin S-receptor-like serine/threonine-protein kinase At1g61500 isoform X1 n=1 Tax=Malus sylvestris TaxID=3752 RepID=UPI0021ABDDFB|nr:G-type lectin S-receptor-like serine/threonine-protein kinase At1g61500 isoform X1 [Malus sylvestris]